MSVGRSTRGPRGLGRGGLLLLLLAFFVVVVAVVLVTRSPGVARGELHSASPGPDAHLSRMPRTVLLDFGSTSLDGVRATVQVIGPDDEDLARGAASMSASTVSQAVVAPQRAGAYQVTYRLVDVDARVTSGRYWFWFAPDSSRWASATWSGAFALLALAALTALVLTLLRNRRDPQPAVLEPEPRLPLVPVQRSRDNHEGTSAPSRRPALEDDRGPRSS